VRLPASAAAWPARWIGCRGGGRRWTWSAPWRRRRAWCCSGGEGSQARSLPGGSVASYGNDVAGSDRILPADGTICQRSNDVGKIGALHRGNRCRRGAAYMPWSRQAARREGRNGAS